MVLYRQMCFAIGWILGLLFLSPIAAQTAVLDITKGDGVLNCTYMEDQRYYAIYMMENNHNFSERTHLFTIQDVTQEPGVSLLTGTFSYEMESSSGSYLFYSTQFFDYENSNQRSFTMSMSSTAVVIYVINYDDENPTLTNPMCSMKENWDYVQENTTCTATLADTDGWITQTTFTIINSNANPLSDCDIEDELFQFEIDRTLSDTVYSTTVFITTKQQLDYEKKIFYSFDVVAQDGAGHGTTPSENVRCIINVEDQNDMPPEFTDYFQSTQIVEKHEYNNFSVKAVDGDKGINADIFYYIIPVDSDEPEDPYISIDKTTGALLFKKIDRDAKDLTTYVFQIMAQEDDEPPFTTNITVTLFLEDIDDNSPLVMSLTNATGDVIDYSQETTKVVHFWFLENFAGTLDGTMTITDIDTGNNALFNVELTEDPSSEQPFTNAFFIVPTAGYRTADFSISVRNATYLDYENPPWDDFQFNVHSSGKLDPTLEDNLLIQISLIDYNDEVPIFAKDDYSVDVEETIGKGELIIQVKATDRDKEDETLTHELVAAQTIRRTMDINKEEGKITVAIDNAFDYDRINPVFFQVRAIDHADPPHITIVPVTVNLIDVNNKAPTYIVSERIEVEENQVIGTVLNGTITASDVDTTRNLTAQIDWDNSFAMKSSARLSNDDPVIRQASQFLDLVWDIQDGSEDGSIDIKLVVNSMNDDQTAPDYETFDTLYLSIIITDLNTKMPEFADKMNTTGQITVNIIDINDNPPIFTNATLNANRTVEEETRAGVIVGTIEATDADIGDIVTYSCTYIEEEYDWFEASETGIITVKADSNIDCDTDQIWTVPINCTATDGLHYTHQTFEIYILDKNNKVPQLEMSDTEVSLEEKKPEGTVVIEAIGYTDGDRDIPYKTATCDLDNYGSDCYATFETINNAVLVKKGAQLDRDRGIKRYPCNYTCTDNIRNVENRGRNQNSSSFTIVLLDINDNCPELITFAAENIENASEGDTIGYVQAMDIDEGVNADIDFGILTTTKDGNLIEEEIFKLVEVEGEYQTENDTVKQNSLIALKDLKDLYGTYVLQLVLSDRGDPQQSTEQPENKDKKEAAKLTVVIKKYNYYQPTFVFPNENQNQITLSLDQEDNTQLLLYKDNAALDDFTILNVENGCSDKWDPTYVVAQTQPENANSFFKIVNQHRCTAQLQVEKYDKAQAKSTVSYKLQLTTTLDIVDQLETDEKPYNASIEITVIFVDQDQEPIFPNNDDPWVVYFLQDRIDTDNTSASLGDRAAHYPNAEENWSIYYFLMSIDDEVQNKFKVDVDTGDLTLREKLCYNDRKSYSFKILASKNKTESSSNDLSYLPVIVNVVDSNIHVPQWTQASFFGAIIKNTVKGTTIVTAEATDEDEIDQGKLKYTIDGNINAFGSDSIKAIPDPFLLTETTGGVVLNFAVDYNMNGYFVFTAKVEDEADSFGNPSHKNTTTVSIYIVTDDNTVNFNFDNTLEEVTVNRVQILEIISKYLDWNCHDQNVQSASQNGQVLNNVTVASIYCVDNDELVTSAAILRKLANINTFQNMRRELSSSLGIWLQAFASDYTASANLEQTLKTALIIVSVVLGTLCAILALTFFLKIRGLNRKLEKLTEPKFGSDESNLNRKGLNVPTSNMFAVEGSNPIYNNEVIKENLMYDKQSIKSDDSGDLIGVEDNPEFDMFGEDKQQRF